MKISVALCTYNSASHLAMQLQSIFGQTTRVHEIIICDDGSQDATLSIISSFQALHPDIIQLHQNESNLGAKKNFEKALTLSTGDIIFLSDQDDIWQPHKVAVSLRFFEQNPAATVVFSNGRIISEQGQQLPYTIWQSMGFTETLQQATGPGRLFEFLIRLNNMVTGAALCIKKEVLSSLLPFYCPQNVWHDYWIALAAACNNRLYFLNEELILYRLHSNQQAGLPQLNDATNKQNTIKEKLWLGQYDRQHTDRFLYYNIGARQRLNIFVAHLKPLPQFEIRFQALNTALFAELEILKKHLFAEMSFMGRKKLALIAILGRQKTLNLSRADILKLLFS